MMEPGRSDHQLEELFAAYREACPTPEAGADFMPRLWERIENRKRWVDPLWRWANGLVAATVFASLFFVLLQVLPAKSSLTATRSYVEMLAEVHETEEMEIQLASWSPGARPGADGAGR